MCLCVHACAWMCLCGVRVHVCVYVWDGCAWVCMCGVRVHGCACVGWVCMCGVHVHACGGCVCVDMCMCAVHVHACGVSVHECMHVCVGVWGRVWGYWAYLQCSTSQMLAVTGFSPHECLDLCPVRTSLTVVTDVSLRSETKHFPCVKVFVVYPFLRIVFHTLCSFFC